MGIHFAPSRLAHKCISDMPLRNLTKTGEKPIANTALSRTGSWQPPRDHPPPAPTTGREPAAPGGVPVLLPWVQWRSQPLAGGGRRSRPAPSPRGRAAARRRAARRRGGAKAGGCPAARSRVHLRGGSRGALLLAGRGSVHGTWQQSLREALFPSPRPGSAREAAASLPRSAGPGGGDPDRAGTSRRPTAGPGSRVGEAEGAKAPAAAAPGTPPAPPRAAGAPRDELRTGGARPG